MNEPQPCGDPVMSSDDRIAALEEEVRQLKATLAACGIRPPTPPEPEPRRYDDCGCRCPDDYDTIGMCPECREKVLASVNYSVPI